MKKFMRKALAGVTAILLMLTLMTGCGSKDGLDPKNPIELTMWHVYGSQTSSPMNTLIEEFNATVGKAKGIQISVTSVSNSDSIHDALVASAKNEPGAGALPDMFVCYPKTAAAMGTELLMDWNGYFNENQRGEYLSAFLDEGIAGGKQIVFPIAKSSEVTFVNKTVFDRFAAATGVTLEALTTWEGMLDAAKKYYERTDGLTPDVTNDGKIFLFYDMPLNYMQLAAKQLGGSFLEGEAINFSDPAAEKAWSLFADAAAAGCISLYDGFGTSQMMTGDAAAAIESTASVTYFKDTVAYAGNTTEPLELISLPFPVFEG